ncbi:IS3 family transposase [Erysipelothrix inopinata]|uniref:IS3 family transposase n=1 Tax=Erysipelothrix inopinata TaxID=225084 RepID=A0A7G9S1M2_9FIRM|nr:IS3 family transposase [Erysipelothrix inopinata]QNN61747.1 IS3 family transposase [Erysipelothrix inopinata]
MCKILDISISGFYKYKISKPKIDTETQRVVRIFNDNQKTYGSRCIRKECRREGVVVSRRRIARIMQVEELISTCVLAHYKVHK